MASNAFPAASGLQLSQAVFSAVPAGKQPWRTKRKAVPRATHQAPKKSARDVLAGMALHACSELRTERPPVTDEVEHESTSAAASQSSPTGYRGGRPGSELLRGLAAPAPRQDTHL